jgi:hypothetical protein
MVNFGQVCFFKCFRAQYQWFSVSSEYLDQPKLDFYQYNGTLNGIAAFVELEYLLLQ